MARYLPKPVTRQAIIKWENSDNDGLEIKRSNLNALALSLQTSEQFILGEIGGHDIAEPRPTYQSDVRPRVRTDSAWIQELAIAAESGQISKADSQLLRALFERMRSDRAT
jgi:hypothetical protein